MMWLKCAQRETAISLIKKSFVVFGWIQLFFVHTNNTIRYKSHLKVDSSSLSGRTMDLHLTNIKMF